MDWGVFIELGIRSKLSDFYHLANLFVANEEFINLLKFLFKYKVLGIFQDFLAIQSDNWFPDFLI